MADTKTEDDAKAAEEAAKRWTSWAALTTVILAVCATLSTFRGSSFSTKTVLNQSMASDQWAYYQAKSIKGNGYETQRDLLALQSLHVPANVRGAYAAKIAEYDKRVKRYDGEKEQISKDAKQFETNRDRFQAISATFGYAVIFLQIAILLASIGVLMKRRWLWGSSLAIGAIGVYYFVRALMLPY